MSFTKAELNKIDSLYANDFANVTPEDVPLIIRWELDAYAANIEYDEKLKALKEESAARLAKVKKEAEYSAETLRILRDEAVARYRRDDVEQEKQK